MNYSESPLIKKIMKTIKSLTAFFVAIFLASNLFAQPDFFTPQREQKKIQELNATDDAKDKIILTLQTPQFPSETFSFKATKNKPFTVNWGDGCIQTFICTNETSVTLKHPYNAAGEYTVTFEASDNNCRFLDFSSQPMFINSWTIKDIEIKGCTALTALALLESSLTDIIGLTECTALTHLSLLKNQLANLDITNCTNLIDLDCSYN